MRALESLDKVGILDKAYTRCDQLSGGQQQRVALARTLNQNPKIILADEPVASLDPITAKQVMQDFVRINKEYKGNTAQKRCGIKASVIKYRHG